MDDASGQLGNNGTEIGYLVSGKNGVRFAISKVAELPPRGAVIQPVTQFVLHSQNGRRNRLPFLCLEAFQLLLYVLYVRFKLFVCLDEVFDGLAGIDYRGVVSPSEETAN